MVELPVHMRVPLWCWRPHLPGMLGRSKPSAGQKSRPETLEGRKQIAKVLGEPVSVVERWASQGKPVFQQAEFVTSNPGN